MSWLQKAMSLVVETDDTAVPAAQPAAKALTAARAPAPMPTASIDQALLDTLMAAALSRKTVFSGLLESSEKMKSVIPDELQRIKAAAAMTGGVTAQAINTAVAGHIQDINVERSKFNREIAAVRAVKVDGPAKLATQHEAQIARERAEVDRLIKSIEQLKAQVAELNAAVAASEAEFATTATQFEAAAVHAEQYLTSLRDTIISALK